MMPNAQQAIIIYKTPASEFDESINWACPSRELGGDTVASSAWAVAGPDNMLVLSDEEIVPPANLLTTVWLSGGTLGAFYIVTNTIVTSGGRTLPQSFIVNIVEYIFISQPRCI